MFNPEKLLSGLLMGGSRRRGGLGGLISGATALGLAGVAMEAVEHFMDKSKTEASGMPPSALSPSQTSPPSRPPSAPGVAAPPPPPPPVRSVSAPPPPPSGSVHRDHRDAVDSGMEAVLLIRAMIAAANADGVIDEEERNQILEKLKTADLSDQEHSFIVKELLSPAGLDDIVAQVKSPETAKRVYTVSLLAIEVDTDAEREYLDTLAGQLGLDDSDLDDIYRTLKIDKS